MSRYLNTNELAERLRVSPRTVANWRKNKTISFIRRNARAVLYDWEEVERELRQGVKSKGTGHFPSIDKKTPNQPRP